MIFVLDNYDSFTYNLVQAIGKLGVRVEVARNDEITCQELQVMNPAGLVLSPGPGRPEDAGNMPAILAGSIGILPILGVCLGHQMIGLHFGGNVVSAPELVHGKSTRVFHDGRTIYKGLPDPFEAGRYHSLIVAQEGLPAELVVTSRTGTGEIMGLRHKSLPVEGVQFHPESILTPDGERLLANFIAMTATK
ncbi:aminodeoxychorismate/anthranilate synthase component II [bacterium]|nr:aminodeoxychorismate/anthranilate synthase component II [bacterium]